MAAIKLPCGRAAVVDQSDLPRTSHLRWRAERVKQRGERYYAYAYKDEDIVGQLAGALPKGHMFEFQCEGTRGVIQGKIDKSLSASDAGQLLVDWMNKTAIATVTVRKVIKEGEVARESFTLKSVRARP